MKRIFILILITKVSFSFYLKKSISKKTLVNCFVIFVHRHPETNIINQPPPTFLTILNSFQISIFKNPLKNIVFKMERAHFDSCNLFGSKPARFDR